MMTVLLPEIAESQFAPSLWTPHAKTHFEGRVCIIYGVEGDAFNALSIADRHPEINQVTADRIPLPFGSVV
jgi:hypothetical protein